MLTILEPSSLPVSTRMTRGARSLPVAAVFGRQESSTIQRSVQRLEHTIQTRVCSAVLYAPRRCTSAARLEQSRDCLDKYTQEGSTCGEDEDAASVALTAMHRLLRRCGVEAGQVGVLRVGSMSLLAGRRSRASVTSSAAPSMDGGSSDSSILGDSCFALAAGAFSSRTWGLH